MTNLPEFKLKKIVQANIHKKKITSSQDSSDYIRQFFSDDIEIWESFFILCLNRANITQGFAKISQGGTAGTVADIKIIAKYAVDSLSSAIILAHNHPSGNSTPSESDKLLTLKAINAMKLLDITVLDHIIITPDPANYFSFADNGLI
jgi:DNA repair protein RadC